MKLNNKYYILRHGEAISNIKGIVSSWPEKFNNHLTLRGKEQIKKSAGKLKSLTAKANKKLDLIFSSDLLRAKQTAEIVSQRLKLKPKFDKRLREIGFGDLNGRPAEELLYFRFEEKRINHSFQKGETYESVLKRVFNFFKNTEKKYKGKNILIISHQCPLWILENRINGFSLVEGLKKDPENKKIGRGELRELN
ncbi:MAG: histidine phosphatase family protein [Candidatus Staskawiczbacteria bacterium]|nr:histidine phosphatase family protein [Candidatus Staskawiczbacteria bacterium]